MGKSVFRSLSATTASSLRVAYQTDGRLLVSAGGRCRGGRRLEADGG